MGLALSAMLTGMLIFGLITFIFFTTSCVMEFILSL